MSSLLAIALPPIPSARLVTPLLALDRRLLLSIALAHASLAGLVIISFPGGEQGRATAPLMARLVTYEQTAQRERTQKVAQTPPPAPKPIAAKPSVLASALPSVSAQATVPTYDEPPEKMQDVDAKMPLAEGEVHTNDSANQLEKAAAAPRQAPSVALGADRDDVQRYLAALMRQLHRYKSYPSALKRDKVEGHVVVQFTLNAGGQIVASRVERSSGHAGLDQAALQMLARANPLPAIPDSMNRTELTLSVPVEYSLITDR